MKILCIIPNMSVGGAENQMALILDKLKDVFSVKLCLFNQTGGLLDKVPRNMEVHNLDKRSRWSIANLVLKLSRLILAEDPDIVYSRLQYANTVTSLAVRRAHRRVVHVAHETTMLSEDISGLRMAPLFKLWVRAAYRNIDRIVAPCEASKNDLLGVFGSRNPR